MLVAGIAHWFLHYTGTDDTSGRWYGFWSGFGSDLGELLILGGLVQFFRTRNCHVDGCWRLGHTDPAVQAPACRRHHSHGHLCGRAAAPKKDS